MSQRIVCRAGIAGITVVGLLLMGSGVASASVATPGPAYAQNEADDESVDVVNSGGEFSARPWKWPPGGCRPPKKPHLECVVTPDAVICRKGCI